MTRRVAPGEPIGEWVLEEMLGRGSFGEVWRARHRTIADRFVALKVPRDPFAIERLVREGVLARRVDVEGVVPLVGGDADHDPPYLAFHYIAGENLRDRLRRGLVPAERALAITRSIVSTLGRAHRLGVVHRDVKPENVLIEHGGRVLLTDFGLAVTREDLERAVAASGSVGSRDGSGRRIVGTLRYMAPEQRDPSRRFDHRADLYAVGLVFFELLTGTLPEGGEVPSDLVPGLDATYDAFFRRCYVRLERRYRDAQEALGGLDAIDASLASRRASVARAETFASRLVELRTRTPAQTRDAGEQPAPKDPNLITWEESRALLRLTSAELERLVALAAIRRVPCHGKLLFRRSEVVELRERLRRRVPAAAPTLVTTTPPFPVLRPPSRVPQPAGAIARSAAGAVDVVIISALASAVSGWASVLCATTPLVVMHGDAPGLFAEDLVLTVVTAVLYLVLSTALFGRTVGKWFAGIKVVGPEGDNLGLVGSSVRALGYLLSALPLGVGFFGIALHPEKRAFHDLIAESWVVHEDW